MKTIKPILEKIYARFQNEGGFTLLEMLYSFFVFTIIIFFISPVFSIMFGQSELKNRLQTMEWEVFCSQMKKEIRMSTNIQVVSNHLILTEDNGTVTFEKYENILRRRVNNSGHEVVLQNVSDVTFTLLPNRIRISVKDLHDKEYITNVYPFIDGSGTP